LRTSKYEKRSSLIPKLRIIKLLKEVFDKECGEMEMLRGFSCLKIKTDDDTMGMWTDWALFELPFGRDRPTR
jgi:hypothetical protein